MSKVETYRELRPGQRRLLRVFERGNEDVVFVPSDPFDLRICSALRERGVLRLYREPSEDWTGYELTPAGRALIQGAEA